MRIELLDHGYLELVESWGSDERIIEAARMSTGKGFLGWGPMHEDACPLAGSPSAVFMRNGVKCKGGLKRGEDGHVLKGTCISKAGDEKLLAYLWNNKHATPFEMAGLTVEVQAPIFVFREWHRHRTQSYNELSARYTPLPDVNYVPSAERLMMNADGSNKQAGTVKDAEALTPQMAEFFRDEWASVYLALEDLYQKALLNGVPKELARIIIPVGRYSCMRASANLRNWLAFLTLRMAPNAQWEIRQYANAVGAVVKKIFPRTWDLFCGREA